MADQSFFSEYLTTGLSRLRSTNVFSENAGFEIGLIRVVGIFGSRSTFWTVFLAFLRVAFLLEDLPEFPPARCFAISANAFRAANCAADGAFFWAVFLDFAVVFAMSRQLQSALFFATRFYVILLTLKPGPIQH